MQARRLQAIAGEAARKSALPGNGQHNVFVAEFRARSTISSTLDLPWNKPRFPPPMSTLARVSPSAFTCRTEESSEMQCSASGLSQAVMSRSISPMVS
jgi:hypothetical protein